jgi:hypothetical protein
VETGDTRTEDSGGLPRSEENVIRLPRDWVGPPEELVPIGSAARNREAQRAPNDDLPQAADAFWSEDSAALHDAVQAPPARPRQRVAPPVGLVPPVAGLRRVPSVHLPGLGALRRLERVSWRSGLPAVGVAALAVAAVIGMGEGPASRRTAPRTPPSHTTASSGLTGSTDAASGEKAAAARSRHVVRRHTPKAHQPKSHVHARTRTRATRGGKTHHQAVTHQSTASSSRTIAETAPSPSPVHSSGSSATSAPTSSSASTVASTGSKPAPRPPGPTGFGTMSGGCQVKCK